MAKKPSHTNSASEPNVMMPNQLKNAAAPRRSWSACAAAANTKGGNSSIKLSSMCCGEAASTRPNTASQIRHRLFQPWRGRRRWR